MLALIYSCCSDRLKCILCFYVLLLEYKLQRCPMNLEALEYKLKCVAWLLGMLCSAVKAKV